MTRIEHKRRSTSTPMTRRAHRVSTSDEQIEMYEYSRAEGLTRIFDVPRIFVQSIRSLTGNDIETNSGKQEIPYSYTGLPSLSLHQTRRKLGYTFLRTSSEGDSLWFVLVVFFWERIFSHPMRWMSTWNSEVGDRTVVGITVQ